MIFFSIFVLRPRTAWHSSLSGPVPATESGSTFPFVFRFSLLRSALRVLPWFIPHRVLSLAYRRALRQSSICAEFLHSCHCSRRGRCPFPDFPTCLIKGRPRCSAELVRPGLAASVHQLGPRGRCPKWHSFFVSFLRSLAWLTCCHRFLPPV
jgi:hypothetical protein